MGIISRMGIDIGEGAGFPGDELQAGNIVEMRHMLVLPTVQPGVCDDVAVVSFPHFNMGCCGPQQKVSIREVRGR